MDLKKTSQITDDLLIFQERQEKGWGLKSFDSSICDNNRLARVSSKINSEGTIQNFQGVTTVFPIVYTNTSAQLASLSYEIYSAISNARLSDLVYQLPPLTHHMTIADIAPNENFNSEKKVGVPIPESLVQDFKDKTIRAFNQIANEKITEITGQIIGIGASVTIAFRVDFQPEEYLKIHKIEKIIKDNTGIDVRDFPGIISAFLMKPSSDLSEKSEELINSLAPFNDLKKRNIIINFSELYYSLFKSMVDYVWLKKVRLLPTF